ncbi:hypothetical protein SAMN04488587_0880 [Methanococcoides vulcani]|uniref:Uncharacterized protein n=1 Tax=Methanococcoides vulcani TaxID=1353158 RepID=A0A1H9Z7M8_9EURY|nr:hypothetical protein [Methanococcoides vulcani]SES76865.1 hypothetical protein SAMN04488587_0880 [Methanococcoides vulcani]
MGREFSDKDKEIFNKLAPENGGTHMSEMGHPYPFILRPISHKIAEDSDDFRERLERLDAEELEYLARLAMEGKEDIRSLDPEDIDSFFELLGEKVSEERVKELRIHLGIL